MTADFRVRADARWVRGLSGPHHTPGGRPETWSNYVGTDRPPAIFAVFQHRRRMFLANKQAAVTAVGMPLMLLPMLMMIVRQVREWRSLHRR